MTHETREFGRFDGEMFFAKRLRDHGVTILAGATDEAMRRERIRSAIIECHLDQTIIGKSPSGKTATYAQCFERFYGEPLNPPVRKLNT